MPGTHKVGRSVLEPGLYTELNEVVGYCLIV